MYGVERYARVEDSYLHIVNVPVRLVSDNVQATSGTVTVTYDNANLKFEQTYTGTIKNDVPTTTPGVVTGGAFSVEAAGTEGTVTVTGSADTIQSTDGMFAHLRFKALDANGVLPKTNIFEVAAASFTDAGEATVTGVAAVNSVYQYYHTTYTGTVDKDWFNGEHVEQGTTEFVITSPDELYGLAELVNEEYITTEKIYLGADITVNTGTIVSKAEDGTITINKTYDWTPIGAQASAKQFAGTFDGQGHTISGLHTNVSTAASNKYYAGLFGIVNTTSTVKNFRIENSYFKAEHYAGSVAGRLDNGTIENVYSEAYLETSQTGAGGIVGHENGNGGLSTIQKCWFKGTANAAAGVCGGIVGVANGSNTKNLIDCLNEGEVSGNKASKVGGLVGRVCDGTTIIKNSLNIGQVSGGSLVGSIVGGKESTCTINNVYALTADKTYAIGSDSENTEVTTFTDANKNTYYGYKALDALRDKWDFENTWVVRENNTPVLKAWCESGALYTPATTWAGGTGVENDPYIIKTASQLYKLANDVNNGTTYDNTFFKLGANITVNGGTSSRWADSAPKYNWIPIGTSKNYFKGNFITSGEMRTISGLYAKKSDDTNSTWYVGLFGYVDSAEVRHVKVQNSYFSGAYYVGGIAGTAANSTIDTVYTNAIIETASGNSGGLVGYLKDGTVNKGWFAGTITTPGSFVGGIVGLGNGTVTGANINNCLTTGKIISTKASGDAGVGGIFGWANSGSAKITNCLSAPEQFTSQKGATNIGYIVGKASSNASTTNTYSTDGTTQYDNYKGYMNTNLDFDYTWVAMENSAPVLQCFAPEEGKFDTTSWYVKAGDGVGTSEENPYLLDSVADMYGFAKRANASTDGFADKYFKLTSSVTFNDGNPTDGEWATTAPYYVWTPIGNSSVYFKGHFDGGNHTISGLYVKNEDSPSNKALWYVGLFGCANDATIKNMSVEDSYFYASYYAAPIAGLMKGGEINNVYSNAIVNVSTGFGGGIAGCLEGGTIQNVWFQGIVSGLHYAGGIVGVNTTTQGYIIHALSDGTVSITGGQAGGIVGRANNALEVQDSLSLSTVTAANTNRGAVAGYVTGSGNLNMVSVYGYCKANVTNGATAATAGTDTDAVISGTAEVFTAIDQAYDTALAGKLDATKWTFRVENYPIPTTFAEGVVTSSDYSVAAAKDAAYVIDTDLSGSGTESDPYLITSAAELYGLAVRSQKEDFSGATISLTSTITINTGDTTEENTVFYEWMPIGDRALPFAGTFKGNGNTISGLYRTFKTWESSWIGMFEMTAEASNISDFNIKNTYFAYTGTSDATRIGSVAGEGYGTFDSIYSDATLKSGGVGVGGILGVVASEGGEANITNCWYDGEIIGTRTGDAHLGGMIGFVYNASVANVAHSLYSGSIQADLGRKIGGVTGYVNSGATLKVTDCLLTGELSGEQQVGIVAGRVKSSATAQSILSINTTWGVNDVVSLDVGSTGYDDGGVAPSIEGKTNISTAKDRFIGMIVGETLASQKDDGEETGFTGWVMIKDGTPVLQSFVKDGGIKTQADVYEYTTVVSALNPNSNYTNWFENTLEYEGDGNYLYTITGQSADVYTAYCDALTSAFNLHSSNTIENVQNCVFTAKNDDLVVDVTYVPADGTNTIYITVSTGKTLSEHLTDAVNYSAKENAVTDDYTLTGDNQLANVTFHMVEQVENLNGSGSSYIIQLKNGHLIVIDGGVSAQAPYLFDYMKSLVKEEGKKPVIDAWIVSHCHRDHIGVFQTIWEDAYKTGEEHKGYAGQVYVNGIYFNEPSDALLTKYLYGDRGYIGYMKRAATLFKTSTNGTPDFYRMQTGHRYSFDDVTMDILLSQELLSIADYDATADVNNCVQTDAINDTSTWCMFTIGTGNNAKKLLTAGDASYSGKNYMCDMYSNNYLTMDIMTALHHGFNTNLSKYSTMTQLTSGANLQEKFSQHIIVESVVLYSFKYDMTKENHTLIDDKYVVNWKYANLNSSFIEHLASKSNSFNNGISVLKDGNTTNRNYLYSGEGTSVLTFGDTITAELKTRISE